MKAPLFWKVLFFPAEMSKDVKRQAIVFFWGFLEVAVWGALPFTSFMSPDEDAAKMAPQNEANLFETFQIFQKGVKVLVDK